VVIGVLDDDSGFGWRATVGAVVGGEEECAFGRSCWGVAGVV
jgi:hypothetical protein